RHVGKVCQRRCVGAVSRYPVRESGRSCAHGGGGEPKRYVSSLFRLRVRAEGAKDSLRPHPPMLRVWACARSRYERGDQHSASCGIGQEGGGTAFSEQSGSES